MKIATVCGGAEGVWKELELSRELIESVLRPGDEWIRMAVSDAGVYHPDPLHVWYMPRPRRAVPSLRRARAQEGRESDPPVWIGGAVGGDRLLMSPSCGKPFRTDIRTHRRFTTAGGSALPCTGIALHFGADAIVLCGNPLSDGPNVFKGTGACGGNAKRIPPWRDLEPGLVRSWSGRTRDVLGEPSREWLAERRAAAHDHQHQEPREEISMPITTIRSVRYDMKADGAPRQLRVTVSRAVTDDMGREYQRTEDVIISHDEEPFPHDATAALLEELGKLIS